MADIAGITNSAGNVLGLMPHPEPVIRQPVDSTDAPCRSPVELMFGRRRLLISGMTAISATLLSRPGPVSPGPGSTKHHRHCDEDQNRAVNPGTWMDQRRPSALQQRCEHGAGNWRFQTPSASRALFEPMQTVFESWRRLE